MTELLLVHDAEALGERDVVEALARALAERGHHAVGTWQLRGVTGGYVAAVASAAASAKAILVVDPGSWWTRGGSRPAWQREILRHVTLDAKRCAVIVPRRAADARASKDDSEDGGQPSPLGRLAHHVLPDEWAELHAWLERAASLEPRVLPEAKRPQLSTWPAPANNDPLSPELVELLEHDWTQMLARAEADRELLYAAMGLLAAALASLPLPVYTAALADAAVSAGGSPRARVDEIAGAWLKVEQGCISLAHPAIARFLRAELGNAELDAHLRLLDVLTGLRASQDTLVLDYIAQHERSHLLRCHGLAADALWVIDVDMLMKLSGDGRLVGQLEAARGLVGPDLRRYIELTCDLARRRQLELASDTSTWPAMLWTELIGHGLSPSWARERLSWRDHLPVVRLCTRLSWADCAVRIMKHAYQVCRCAIDRDGAWALSGTTRGQVVLWSLRSGTEQASFDFDSWIGACAMTPDATRGVIAFDAVVVLLDLDNRSEIGRHTAHGADVASVAISADGRRVLSADESGDIVLWRVDRQRHDRIGRHGARVRNCSMSDDGSLGMSGDEAEKVKFWDLDAGTQLSTHSGHSYDVNAVSISPDGSRAVSLCINHARIWEPRSGRELAKHESMGVSARTCVLVDGGKSLLVADYGEHVCRYRVDDGALEVRHIAHSDDIMDLAATPDGQWYLTCGGDHTLRLWQQQKVKPVSPLTGSADSAAVIAARPITALAPATDGVSVWTSNGYDGARRLRVQDGTELDKLGDSTIHGIAEHDGRLVLVGSSHRVDVFRVAGRERLASWSPTGDWLRAVAIEPGGRRLAYAGDDGKVYCSDLAGQDIIELRGATDWMRVLGWAAPDRLISGGDDGCFRVWDVGRRSCVVETKPIDGRAIHALAIERDWERAAVGGNGGGVVIVNVLDGEVLTKFEGHDGKITGLCYARDDRVLISVGDDAILRVWEAVDGRLLARFDAPFGLTRVVVVGQHIVTADVAGNVMSLEVDWQRLGLR